MASNGRVGRPGPADDTNSDLGPQYLGAPRDESAPGPEPGVEGAAADGGRLDRARTAGPAACRRGYPNLPGTPGGCRLAGTGPMRSPGGGTPEVQDLVSGGGVECGDKAQWTRTMGEWAAWQKR